jgi:hypothetical protein
MKRREDEGDMQIITGVADANFPTSSSICMIFLILACMLAWYHLPASYHDTTTSVVKVPPPLSRMIKDDLPLGTTRQLRIHK